MSEEANIDLIEWMYFGVQKPAKKQKVTSSSSYFWDIYSRQEQKKRPATSLSMNRAMNGITILVYKVDARLDITNHFGKIFI